MGDGANIDGNAGGASLLSVCPLHAACTRAARMARLRRRSPAAAIAPHAGCSSPPTALHLDPSMGPSGAEEPAIAVS